MLLVLGSAAASEAGPGRGAAARARVPHLRRSDASLFTAHRSSALRSGQIEASARRLVGARHGRAVRRLGSEVPWMRRAASDTFFAGGGRLLTKVYPLPVNYRTRSGAFARIRARLVRSGPGFRQAANSLGVWLPRSLQRPLRFSNTAGKLTLSLSHASGSGQVAGGVERFPVAARGVGLTLASMNFGIRWQARLSGGAIRRGLTWFVPRSTGLHARLARDGVEFFGPRRRAAWVLGAPSAYDGRSRQHLRTRLSLVRAHSGYVIAIHLVEARASGAAKGSLGASATSPLATVATPSFVLVGGAVFPGTQVWLGGSSLQGYAQTGDCYLNSQSPGTSFCSDNTNYVSANDHTVVNFDIADNVPDHVQVLLAYATMTLNSETSTTPEDVGVWELADPWTNSASWTNYDGTHPWTTAGGDTTGAMEDHQRIGAETDPGNGFYWDIDRSTQGWVDGNPPRSFGLMFAPTDPSSASNRLGFGKEGDANGNDPYISILYEPRMGDYPGSRYDPTYLTDGSALGVNVANGDLQLSNQDLSLPGQNGFDLNIGRYYNSLSTDQTSFGLGWSMGPGFDSALYVPSDARNTIAYLDGTGSAETFHTDVDGNWVMPAGVNASITMDDDNTWGASSITLNFPQQGISETFAKPGSSLNVWARLTSISDLTGDTIHYYYNAAGQLDHAVDTHGDTTSFDYSPAGYISKITTPAGATASYVQDDNGHLTSYTNAAGGTTQYGYDSFGNLTQITAADGTVTKISYDPDTNGATSVTQLASASDTTGPTSTYQYSAPSGTCAASPGWTQTMIDEASGEHATFCGDDLSRVLGAPTNIGAPTISGTPQDGETLSADAGAWAGNPPLSYSDQWQRCDSNADNCSDIPGATNSTYDIASSDVGSRLRVVVTATNSTGSVTATSPPADPVAAKPPPTVTYTYSYDVDGRLTSVSGQ
jgi:YD repeat-containing protein